jgi:hypothetical protein
MPPIQSEDTLIGNELKLQMGSQDSPPVFTDFCSANDVSGLGESKPQVDVTTLCDLARKFRGGLAEGAEVTIAANLIQGDELTRDMFAAYQADDVVPFRLLVGADSPQEFFAFSGSILGWTIANPIGDKATMTFTVKISGGVQWVYTP